MILFIVIIIRFYFLQVINNKKYLILSNNNRLYTKYIYPKRGNIYDRNDIQLTKNIKIYGNEKKKWNDFIEFSLNSNRIDFQEKYQRYCNFPEYVSHIVGYTNFKNIEDKLIDNFLYGKTGIERIFNEKLSGSFGYKIFEIDSKMNIMRVLESKNEENGENIKLTIDILLQKYIHNIMENLNGSVIVMDIWTGEIYAMYSSPTFNINKFETENFNNYWNTLLGNEYKPLINKSINSRYQPGSTFKLITAITALKEKWNMNKKIKCSGKIKIDQNTTFHCWYKKGHGNLNLIEAIKHSCNVYFITLASKLNIEDLMETAKDFGLGEEYNLELGSKDKGIIPTRKWKEKIFKQKWFLGDTLNISIGQGYVAYTPLELVVMISRIANGGHKVKPFLLYDNKKKEENLNLFNREPFIDESILDTVKEGLYKGVNEKGGTSYNYRILEERYKMAGKTGTAQVISKINKEKNKNKKYDNNALFIGYAPFNKPKYAISVVIENGISGSGSALPVAQKVLLYAQKNKIGYVNEN